MAVRPRVNLFTVAIAFAIVMSTLVQVRSVAATSFADQLIYLTNVQRQNIKGPNCPNLVSNPALMNAAQQHASDMAARNYFSHRSLNGATPWQRISDAGYSARRAAENIGAGQVTPEEVVARWMRSPTHRANILNCRYQEIGVGFAYADGSQFHRYWVQDFGTSW